MSQTDPLVSAKWLKDNIGMPDVRVVEASWYPPWIHHATTARQDYEAGHIPGAVFFDLDEIADRSSDLPHMLPPAELFSSRMRKAGIGDGHRIIIYDRNNFCAAARVWWTFRVMGHRDVFVLDGGLAAWEEAGGEIEDMPPMPSERHHTVRLQGDLVKSLAQVRAAIGDGHTQILDARNLARFAGDVEEPRPGLARGHIPGSLNLLSDRLIEDGLMRDADELEAIFERAGVDPGAPVICTCGSGVTAAILALGLARIGAKDVSVYDGSWAEWGADPANPVETGPPRARGL